MNQSTGNQPTPLDYPGAQPAGTTGAARFRFEDGRRRWYRDTLAADADWSTTDAEFENVTSLLDAFGSDWSNVTIYRIADAFLAEPDRWDGMDRRQVADDMKRVNADGLDAASSRGTSVHLLCEEHLTGQAPLWLDEAAEPYRAAVGAWFDKYQPEPMLTEAVSFNRTLGYAGTLDAILRIDGATYVLDWKSRSKSHACYPKEVAQLGAHALAEYVIGDDDVRRPLPGLDAGLIVSITPTGCRTYEVAL